MMAQAIVIIIIIIIIMRKTNVSVGEKVNFLAFVGVLVFFGHRFVNHDL